MFQIDKTWGGTEMIHISELEFWGQDPNKESTPEPEPEPEPETPAE